jgi:hypothetical protein
MIPIRKNQHYERWDAFENAATHSYARSIVTAKKKKDVSTTDDGYLKSSLGAFE